MQQLLTSRPRRLWLVGLVAALLLAGCGSGSGSEPAASGSSGSSAPASSGDGEADAPDEGGVPEACGAEIYVASVCAEVSITGASTLEGTAVSPVGGAVGADGPATCASWTEGEDDRLRLPLFLDGTNDGTAFAMESLVTDYSGPGTYGLDSLSGEGSNFTIVVGDLRYQPHPEGTSSGELTVAADGSGSLTAGGFVVQDGSGGVSDPIDAEVSWTCTDA